MKQKLLLLAVCAAIPFGNAELLAVEPSPYPTASSSPTLDVLSGGKPLICKSYTTQLGQSNLLSAAGETCKRSGGTASTAVIMALAKSSTAGSLCFFCETPQTVSDTIDALPCLDLSQIDENGVNACIEAGTVLAAPRYMLKNFTDSTEKKAEKQSSVKESDKGIYLGSGKNSCVAKKGYRVSVRNCTKRAPVAGDQICPPEYCDGAASPSPSGNPSTMPYRNKARDLIRTGSDIVQTAAALKTLFGR